MKGHKITMSEIVDIPDKQIRSIFEKNDFVELKNDAEQRRIAALKELATLTLKNGDFLLPGDALDYQSIINNLIWSSKMNIWEIVMKFLTALIPDKKIGEFILDIAETYAKKTKNGYDDYIAAFIRIILVQLGYADKNDEDYKSLEELIDEIIHEKI